MWSISSTSRSAGQKKSGRMTSPVWSGSGAGAGARQAGGDDRPLDDELEVGVDGLQPGRPAPDHPAEAGRRRCVRVGAGAGRSRSGSGSWRGRRGATCSMIDSSRSSSRSAARSKTVRGGLVTGSRRIVRRRRSGRCGGDRCTTTPGSRRCSRPSMRTCRRWSGPSRRRPQTRPADRWDTTTSGSGGTGQARPPARRCRCAGQAVHAADVRDEHAVAGAGGSVGGP